ncbi:MAG TPA: EamA family transporter, partial [Trebonia sp.]|nr:EamA family transporter [Trebonia sp.]
MLPAPGLVLGGIAGLQCGAALTSRLFPAVGPAGAVTLRLFIAAVVLVAAWRPGLRWDRGTWALVAGAGTLIAIHHLSYYEALDRIPLGAATTVEFSGPFLIAAAGSRRAIDALWTCL